MKEESKRFLFGMCMALFVCLLISGADRLVVQQGTETSPPVFRVVPAYFRCAPMSRAQIGEYELTEQRTADDSALIVQNACTGSSVHEPVFADANGNVLRSLSYMRSVYQSFDLGDGFV